MGCTAAHEDPRRTSSSPHAFSNPPQSPHTSQWGCLFPAQLRKGGRYASQLCCGAGAGRHDQTRSSRPKTKRSKRLDRRTNHAMSPHLQKVPHAIKQSANLRVADECQRLVLQTGHCLRWEHDATFEGLDRARVGARTLRTSVCPSPPIQSSQSKLRGCIWRNKMWSAILAWSKEGSQFGVSVGGGGALVSTAAVWTCGQANPCGCFPDHQPFYTA